MSKAVRAAHEMQQMLALQRSAERSLLDALSQREHKPGALRQLPVRVHPAVHAALQELANAKKMSVNSLIDAAIDDIFVKHGRARVVELDPQVLLRLR